MARFDFASSEYGPLIVAALMKDDTAASLFGDDKAWQQMNTDADFKIRLENHAITPDDMRRYIRPLFESFARETDPSAERRGNPWKYLDWICRSYLQAVQSEEPVPAEDLYKVKSDLRDFEAFRQKGGRRQSLPEDQRDIRSYPSFKALSDTLRPYQKMRDARKAAKEKAGEKVMAETTVVYEGDEGRIVIPQTKEACQFWGRQTRWCIAATESRNYFDTYNETAPIYIYLPDPSLQERQLFPFLGSFKFCGTNERVYDETDTVRSSLFPCMSKLIQAAEDKLHRKEETKSQAITGPGSLAHFRQFGSFNGLSEIVPPDGGLWQGQEAIRNAIKRHPDSIYFSDIDESLAGDRPFLTELLTVCESCNHMGVILSCFSDELRNDSDLIWDIIKALPDKKDMPFILEGCGPAIMDNADFIQAAFEIGLPASLYTASRVIELAGDKIKNNPDVQNLIKEAVFNPHVKGHLNCLIEVAGEEIRDDPEVIQHAIGKCNGKGVGIYTVLRAAGPSVRDNEEIIRHALQETRETYWIGSIYRTAGEKARNDANVYNTAIKLGRDSWNIVDIFEISGENIKSDRRLVMQAYRQSSLWAQEIFNAAAQNIKDEWFFRLKANLYWDRLFISDKNENAAPDSPNP